MVGALSASMTSTSAACSKNWRINLYSDTQTLPTPAMQDAISQARLGDEQARLDPTVVALEAKAAAILAKEEAVFLPSGTMANLIAALVHCRRHLATIAHQWSHIHVDESGGISSIAGSMVLPVVNDTGDIVPQDIETILANTHLPPVGMISVEQTFNACGGRVIPLEQIQDVHALAQKLGVAYHIDGARLFNAALAQGIDPAHYGNCCDSVWIDFTKGLGCPFGAVLAGTHDFVAQARYWKAVLGGNMRQSGLMASAALYALENHVTRLAIDHKQAQTLAQGLAPLAAQGLTVTPPQTNMVFMSMDESVAGFGIHELMESLAQSGIRSCLYWRGQTPLMRLVTHLGITESDIEEAIAEIHGAFQRYH